MGPLILLDTSELLRPMPRKLHAAWAEVHGRKAAMPPTVALELAPLAIPGSDLEGGTPAELLLQAAGSTLTNRDERRLQQQVWWGQMWRDENSPYKVLNLSKEQQELTDELARRIDPKCFRNAMPAYVAEHHDTRIVCESMALGAKMLLTSNMRSIDHARLNDWAVENGERLGVKAEPVVYEADAAMERWTQTPEGLERWLTAGLIACWPLEDNPPGQTVVDKTIKDVERMTRGTGGRLARAGKLLSERLKTYPDAERLAARVRQLLPSPTISTDRKHPSYPQRPTITTAKPDDRGHGQKWVR